MIQELAPLHVHVGESFGGQGKGVTIIIRRSLPVEEIADHSWADVSTWFAGSKYT